MLMLLTAWHFHARHHLHAYNLADVFFVKPCRAGEYAATKHQRQNKPLFHVVGIRTSGAECRVSRKQDFRSLVIVVVGPIVDIK